MKSHSPPAQLINGTEHIKIGALGCGPGGERFVELMIDKTRVLARIDRWGKEDIHRLNLFNAHLIDRKTEAAFTARIQAIGSREPRFEVAMQLGWHGHSFVLPDRVIGPSKHLRTYLGHINEVDLSKYRGRGTLGDWKRFVRRIARGNSRCQLVLALAFVGPVGPVLGVEQVAVQLVGDGETGKTTLAKLAGSVWGRHCDPAKANSSGFGETWNHTLNHIEPVASAHNHTLGIFDETRQVAFRRAETILNAAMRLERGVRKGRLNEPAHPGWWVPILSTSNRSLDQMAAEDDEAVDEAYRGRLIDVPNPNPGSAFERLGKHADVAALCAQTEQKVASTFGQAGPEFVRQLGEWLRKDQRECRTWLNCRRSAFQRKAKQLRNSADRSSRAVEKFSTIYAAGCLAIRFGILPFSKPQLRRSLLACLRFHVDLVISGELPAREAPSSLGPLLKHVAQNAGEFEDLRKGPLTAAKHDHRACPGYLANVGGEPHYFFSEELLKRIYGSKKSVEAAKRALNQRNAIWRDGKGRFARKVRIISQESRQYVVAIKASTFPPADDPGKLDA